MIENIIKMCPSIYKVNKLLFLERVRHAYMDPRNLQTELHSLLIPGAGIYFRQDAECDILSQHIQLPFFSLWINDIFPKKDIVIRPFTPVPTYTLHFMFEDSLWTQSRQNKEYLLEERECNLFSLQPGLHKIPMAKSKKILSLHINIDPAAIPALMQQYPVLQSLEISRPGSMNGRVNQYAYHINPTCDFLIRQILTCQYTGTSARCFLYRCCLDLLLNIATQQAMCGQLLLFSTVMNGGAYHDLFKYLETHPYKYHPVAELAYMFEIPVAELAHGFRQLFAVSIEEFTHMAKMVFLYDRITSGLFSLPVLAGTVGYDDVAIMLNDVKTFYGDCIL